MPLPLLPLIIGAGGMVVKGVTDAVGSGGAASKQAAGAKEARSIIDRYYGQAAGYQQPYYQQGTQAYRQLGRDLGAGTYNVDYSQEYQTPEFNYQADPGYAYRQQEGIRGIEGSAAVGGKGFSGATQRALMRFGQGLASQEYGNAFNRYTNQRDFGYNQFLNRYGREAAEKGQRYGRAASMAGTGVGAATNLSNLATGAGQAIADTVYDRANAQAAGRMGVTSSIGNIGRDVSQAAMMYGLYQQPNTQTTNIGQVGQQPYYPPQVPYYPYG